MTVALDVADILARESATGTSSGSIPSPRPDDLALLIYTSGTTGRPKGVRLDHANVDAMTNALKAALSFTTSDRALLVLPLFHVNAIMISVVAPLAAGASAMLLPKFDHRTFWKSVEAERPTFFSAVPAIYLLLRACLMWRLRSSARLV
jgi:long-chain acyl-CoA synthetase